MRAGLFFVVALAWGSGKALPSVRDDLRLDSPPSNFIGEGTNELATALLQGFVEHDTNFVYSPLGYSVILAIMAEGARGETRNQLVKALHLPEDTYAVRQNYKTILQSMREKWSKNKPEFKNWFYVYKNYTVNDAYKQTLLDCYLTEVKRVVEVHYEIDFEHEENKETTEEKVVENTTLGSKIEEEFGKDTATENKDTPSVDKDEVRDELKKTDEKDTRPTSEEKGEGQNDSQSNRNKTTAEAGDKYNEENKPEKKTEEGTTLDSETKMIVFNGLYFRGAWKTPFKLIKDEENRNFYTSLTEKKQVSMMQTSGNFNIGSIPELDAQALELPYEGDQYSMLILLPNQRDGLNKLTADITGFSLNNVYKYLVDKTVDVFLPKYQIQTISHPKKILHEYGVSDVFTELADLSGISSDKLRMGALVQLVNFQVDEGTSDTNFLTTLNTKSYTVEAKTGVSQNNAEKFLADHPFLFFVRDHTKNILLTAGKVLDPFFYSDDEVAP